MEQIGGFNLVVHAEHSPFYPKTWLRNGSGSISKSRAAVKKRFIIKLSFSNLQLAARKGLHRFMFSATKKWFGGKQAEKAAVTGLDMGGK